MKQGNKPNRRRGFLKDAMLIGGAAAIGLAQSSANAQQKVAKSVFQYQDTPKDGKQCSTCEFFIAGAKPTCKIVEGDITPNGWCSAWVQKKS